MHAAIAAILLAVALLAARPAEAAIAFVRAATAQGTSVTIDTTGATFLAVCSTTVSNFASLSDSRANTYSKALTSLTINDTTSLWASVLSNPGTSTVLTLSSGNAADTLVAAAFSGLPGAVVERTASQTQAGLSSGATISSGNTATTITADQVVLGCAQLSTNANFTWTATGGATLAGSLGQGASASTGALSYQVVSATGVQAATFTATASGSAATLAATVRAGVVDTIAPTTPAGCSVTASGSSTTIVACAPSTDNVGVCSYPTRYCTGAACAPSTLIVPTPTTPSVTHTGLTANTVYRYTMQAVDCSANASSQSAPVEATTLPVTECNYSWTAPVGGVTPDLYTVFGCDTTAASCVPGAIIGTATPPTVSLKDTACPQPVRCMNVAASTSGVASATTTTACVSSPTQIASVLSVIPTSLTFAATINGSNPAAKTLTIQNGTVSTMSWTAAKDQAWISSLAPNSGTNTTQVTVNISIAGLTAGTYQGNITVSAPGATNSPTTIPVTLNLSPAVTPSSGRSGRVR